MTGRNTTSLRLFNWGPDASEELAPLKSYSKLAVGQANLFAGRDLSAQSEQTYRVARDILANNVEATTGLSELLALAEPILAFRKSRIGWQRREAKV